MCNLYSETKAVDAIRAIVRDLEGGRGLNLPPLPGIFPDQLAPVVTKDAKGVRTLEMMRWGFPPPEGEKDLVTNARRLQYGFWQPHLDSRCLVPVTAFCEYQDGPPPKIPTWFARPAQGDDTRPLFFFAGLWCTWTGSRGPKKSPIEGEHRLFTFLTTRPNDLVKAVHKKAMPVILSDANACNLWLDGSLEEALKLQAPAPEDWLTIVNRGPRKDEG
jgi:putative SOS response-associated peptidase YedK